MKVIFAQGNPGEQYEHTRHNVGFLLIEAYAKSEGASWKEASKFHAKTAELTKNGEKVLLVKPDTFYNETGMSARAIIDFYKLDPSDLLVIHDDLALPFGTLRTRLSGSDAGNNGIKSINATLGQNYARIRVGTWNELRNRMDDVNFVLGKFTAREKEALKLIFPEVEKLLNSFIQSNFTAQSITLELA